MQLWHCASTCVCLSLRAVNTPQANPPSKYDCLKAHFSVIATQFWELRHVQHTQHAPSVQHMQLWRRASTCVCLSLLRAVAPGTAMNPPPPVAAHALRPGMPLDIVKDTPVSSLMVRLFNGSIRNHKL